MELNHYNRRMSKDLCITLRSVGAHDLFAKTATEIKIGDSDMLLWRRVAGE